MTKVIGITGGIASGKSTIGKLLREKGFQVTDLDQTVHDLEEQNQTVINKITSQFGKTILENGKLNRKKLAEIVFGDKTALKQLVRILNPFLIKEINHVAHGDLVFIEAPTLFENGLQIYFDQIVMITCNPIVQRQRLIERNHLTSSKANVLINSQWPQSIKKELSDFVIDSSGELTDLPEQVQRLIDSVR